MKLLKIGIFWFTLLIFFQYRATDQTILIFLDTVGQKMSDDQGMNVAHQFLTAMIQQAAPVLVSQKLWSHILTRRQRFQDGLKVIGSLQKEVERLYQTTNKTIAQGLELSVINQTCGDAWYHKNFSKLSKLSADQSKAVLFDYFCYRALPPAFVWKWYQVPGGYLLGIPHEKNDGLNLKGLKSLSIREVMLPQKDSVSKPFVAVLSKCLQQDLKRSWSFYVTGHGHHKDTQHDQSAIAGMFIEEFHTFLLFLNHNIKTNCLVYSSCYSAGTHLVKPYYFNEASLLLRYPVFVTCLTDAPTYVFGLPAGMKLPPYNETIFLEQSDIYNKSLSWYFLQNFNQFCKRAKSPVLSAKDLIQSISAYKQCDKKLCTLSMVENIPLVRYAGIAYFVPVDITFVDILLHDSMKDRVVHNAYALLWYIKHYSGCLQFKDRLPQFVSMIPGNGVFHVSRCEALAYDLSQFLKQSFFAMLDIVGQQIFLFDQLHCQLHFKNLKNSGTAKLEDVMIIPSGQVMPALLSAQSNVGLCVFRFDGVWYLVVIGQDLKDMNIVELNDQHIEQLKKFREFLMKENYNDQSISADILLLPEQFKHRSELWELMLKQCAEQNVCKKL